MNFNVLSMRLYHEKANRNNCFGEGKGWAHWKWIFEHAKLN